MGVEKQKAARHKSVRIGFPLNVNGRQDVTENVHGAPHASNETGRTFNDGNQLRYGFASLGYDYLLALALYFIEEFQALRFEFTRPHGIAHNHGHYNMVT